MVLFSLVFVLLLVNFHEIKNFFPFAIVCLTKMKENFYKEKLMTSEFFK